MHSPWQIGKAVPMHTGFIPMAMAAMGAVSAISGQMNQNKAHGQALKQHGIQQAVAEQNQLIAQAGLVNKASKVAQQSKATELQIEQASMATQAQAEVNAAAAGIEGNSVEVTHAEVEASEGRAQGALQIQEQNAYNQINQESRDISASAQMAEKLAPVDPNNEMANMVGVFNSGLSAYLGAR
jgi:hypothetical protein